MSKNKNQHYVPRCYLKPFTSGEGGLAINLLNLASGRIVRFAPVKSQCSRDYFYGDSSELDRQIQVMEGTYSSVLRRIRPPKSAVNNADAFFLASFWMFQHLRTESMQRSILNMASKFEKAAGMSVPEMQFGAKTATLIGLSAFAKSHSEISDLNVVLVENNTKLPFITSDNPAIKTNRWAFLKSESGSANFGILSAGLIALLPLSPMLQLVMYDKDVYSIPHDRRRLVVKSEWDVSALNQLQMLNCLSNVYFSDGSLDEQICAAPEIDQRRAESGERVQVFRERLRGVDNTYYRASDGIDLRKERGLFVTSTYYPRPLSWPSFIKWRVRGFYYSNGSGVGQVRRDKAKNSAGYLPFARHPTGH